MKRTRDEIKGDLGNGFVQGGITNLNVGGVARTQVEVVAEVIGDLYDYGEDILKSGMAMTAEGDWLELKVRERGLSRMPAEKTRGYVRFYRQENVTENVPIPAGIQVGTKKTKSGPQYCYETLQESTVAQGQMYVDVEVEATQYGAEYNIGVEKITELLMPVPGIKRVLNLRQDNAESWLTSPGADIESDDRLRERYFLSWDEHATGATIDTYRFWALSVSTSVGFAYVDTSFPKVPGMIHINVLGPEGETLTDTIDDVKAYIDERRPAGDLVGVQSPIPVLIDLELAVLIYPGFFREVTQDEILKMLSAYFHPAGSVDYPWIKPLSIGQEVLYSTLIQICTRPEAVYKVDFNSINGQYPGDVAIDGSYVARLGTVTFVNKEITF